MDPGLRRDDTHWKTYLKDVALVISEGSIAQCWPETLFVCMFNFGTHQVLLYD